MDDIAQFKQSFFQECEELLGGLELQLMALKDGGRDEELLHAAFRAIHSLKGGAGVFGFDRLIEFADKFEAVLDLLRGGQAVLNEETIAASLRAADVLADLVGAARENKELKKGFEDAAAAELASAAGVNLQQLTGGGEAADPTSTESHDREAVAGEDSGHTTYCIGFRPHTGMLKRNNDPLPMIRQLKELGELAVTADLSLLPSFEELDPTAAYHAWLHVFEGDEVVDRWPIDLRGW